MGSSPANEVKRTKKWTVQVTYCANGHRTSTTIKGLDAPTESEVLKELYRRESGLYRMKYTDIDITNQWSYLE